MKVIIDDNWAEQLTIDFEGSESTNFSYTDSSVTKKHGTNSLKAEATGNGAMIDFAFDYSSSPLDISAYDHISFWFYGIGNSDEWYFYLEDNEGNSAFEFFDDTAIGWQLITFELSAFDTIGDPSLPFKWNKVVFIETWDNTAGLTIPSGTTYYFDYFIALASITIDAQDAGPYSMIGHTTSSDVLASSTDTYRILAGIGLKTGGTTPTIIKNSTYNTGSCEVDFDVAEDDSKVVVVMMGGYDPLVMVYEMESEKYTSLIPDSYSAYTIDDESCYIAIATLKHNLGISYTVSCTGGEFSCISIAVYVFPPNTVTTYTLNIEYPETFSTELDLGTGYDYYIFGAADGNQNLDGIFDMTESSPTPPVPPTPTPIGGGGANVISENQKLEKRKHIAEESYWSDEQQQVFLERQKELGEREEGEMKLTSTNEKIEQPLQENLFIKGREAMVKAKIEEDEAKKKAYEEALRRIAEERKKRLNSKQK